jgi:hypothetical protein
MRLLDKLLRTISINNGKEFRGMLKTIDEVSGRLFAIQF